MGNGEAERAARTRSQGEKQKREEKKTKECRVFVYVAIRNRAEGRCFAHRDASVRFRGWRWGGRREIDAVDLATLFPFSWPFRVLREACVGPSPKELGVLFFSASLFGFFGLLG